MAVGSALVHVLRCIIIVHRIATRASSSSIVCKSTFLASTALSRMERMLLS